MSRINFRNDGEEHNFWQNYTDLMSGFLIVFIVASLVAYSSYMRYVDLYHRAGVTEANIHDIYVNAELAKKIKEFQEAQKSLDNKYYSYNDTYNRFECKVDVMFASDDSNLPEENKEELIEAGRALEEILIRFSESTNIAFKIIIEGRAARPHGVPFESISKNRLKQVENLSYRRARNLYEFWKSKNILTDVQSINGEVFISGSGFEGQGRYTGFGENGEDKNKTFIIQIIPYIQY
jgi:hypothetical protein